MRLTFGVGFVLPLLLLSAATLPSEATAQQTPAAPSVQLITSPSLELTYAYTHTNGPPGSCGCINLNGGGVAFLYPLPATRFSLVGQFSAADAGGLGSAAYDLKFFTYTAGTRYSPKWKYSTLEPYGEILIGAVHAGGSYVSAAHLRTSFAASAGGGLNLRLHHHLGLKLFQADYVANTFGNGTNDHQNDLRLSAGLILFLHH